MMSQAEKDQMTANENLVKEANEKLSSLRQALRSFLELDETPTVSADDIDGLDDFVEQIVVDKIENASYEISVSA